MNPSPYPKPSDIGGTLIRKVIALFKAQEVSLPLGQSVFISVSGGVDSSVVAALLQSLGLLWAEKLAEGTPR